MIKKSYKSLIYFHIRNQLLKNPEELTVFNAI